MGSTQASRPAASQVASPLVRHAYRIVTPHERALIAQGLQQAKDLVGRPTAQSLVILEHDDRFLLLQCVDRALKHVILDALDVKHEERDPAVVHRHVLVQHDALDRHDPVVLQFGLTSLSTAMNRTVE